MLRGNTDERGAAVMWEGDGPWAVLLGMQGDGLWCITAWKRAIGYTPSEVTMQDIVSRDLAADICAAMVRLFLAEEG